MLVLSRRQDQKILFPSLGISVEVLGFRGSNVRLGVDAPPSVRILREELLDGHELDWDFEKRENEWNGSPDSGDNSPSTIRHKLNNRLNALSLKLQVAEKLFARGDSDRGLEHVHSVLDELSDLELNEADNERSSASPVTACKTEDSVRSRLKLTVLLVEDNANERHLLSTILQMAGINVKSVTNGEEAIDYLEKNPLPDLILIDMQMPRLNGPQTISIIRNNQRFSKLPIYGVSGSSRTDVNVPISDRGVNGWFAKPVRTDKLIDRIFDDCGIKCKNFAELN